MFQTGYSGITTLSANLPYEGGFCRWWYIPVQDVAFWPSINPQTGYLVGEPVLKAGKAWFGPVSVPNSKLGYKETQEKAKPGIFYKQQIEGIYPGDSPASRVNLENMAHYRFVAVGKLRAGGMHLLIGSEESWLEFDHEFTTNHDAATAKIVFAGETVQKALVLTEFNAASAIPPPDGSTGGDPSPTPGGANDVEVIGFTESDNITVQWNSLRSSRFGSFPLIEVWTKEAGIYTLNSIVDITIDAPPPAQSLFNISLTGPATGFIVVK